ncbi:hypothetical protein Acsp01_73400 [Actinoplanes sp. NBRC 101535]|nr:hypothetical protein Acsp01_73400 [Actinoplanes sp. NBRC 101535]
MQRGDEFHGLPVGALSVGKPLRHPVDTDDMVPIVTAAVAGEFPKGMPQSGLDERCRAADAGREIA